MKLRTSLQFCSCANISGQQDAATSDCSHSRYMLWVHKTLFCGLKHLQVVTQYATLLSPSLYVSETLLTALKKQLIACHNAMVQKMILQNKIPSLWIGERSQDWIQPWRVMFTLAATMYWRATITLGTGPHSSLINFFSVCLPGTEPMTFYIAIQRVTIQPRRPPQILNGDGGCRG